MLPIWSVIVLLVRSSLKSWWYLVLLAPAQPCLPRRRRWRKEEVGRRKSSTSVVQPGRVMRKGHLLLSQINDCDRVYTIRFFPKKKSGFFFGRHVEQSIRLTWGFPKIGVPRNGWFINENPIKWMSWGYPFLETSISIRMSCTCFHYQIRFLDKP